MAESVFGGPVESTGGAVGGAVGGGLWDVIAGGATDAKSVEAAKQQSGALLQSAKSGGFRISEEGMKPLVKSIDNMLDRLQELTRSSEKISQIPKLGEHPYGQTVASHDQQTATGDRSATVVVQQFREVLVQAREALERAAGVYKENESQQQSAFGGGQV